MPKKSKSSVEIIDADQIKFDPENPRSHPQDNLDLITDSVKELGFARSVVIDENDQLLAGEGATRGAILAGLKSAIIIDAEGDQIVAVRRRNLTQEQKDRLKIVDNRANELSTWNNQRLVNLLSSHKDDLKATGFSGDDLTHLLAVLESQSGPPNLDDLEAKHGAADDADVFSKKFEIILPMSIYKQFMEFWGAVPGDSDEDKAVNLMSVVSAVKTKSGPFLNKK